MRALAEALFPGLYQDAEAARSAKQEALATFLETSAAKMDCIIAAVSSRLGSSAKFTVLSRVWSPDWVLAACAEVWM